MRPQVGFIAITAFSAVQTAPIPGRHEPSTTAVAVCGMKGTNLAHAAGTDVLQSRGAISGIVADVGEDVLTSDVAALFKQRGDRSRGLEDASASFDAQPIPAKQQSLSHNSVEALTKSQTKDRNAPDPTSDPEYTTVNPPFSKFDRVVQPTNKKKYDVPFRHPQENPFTISSNYLGLQEAKILLNWVVQQRSNHLREYLQKLVIERAALGRRLHATEAQLSQLQTHPSKSQHLQITILKTQHSLDENQSKAITVKIQDALQSWEKLNGRVSS